MTRNSPDDYYAGCNPALLRAVPEEARAILDVGCGEGRLGAALREGRPDRVVYGIEMQPDAAARAAGRLDRVFAIDVADRDPPLQPASLDCISFGDVLEHLIDPEAVLRRLRRFLAPGGVVVASIPNIQHHTILAALLRGDFQYTSAGLLDVTHLRFFTSSTIVKLFLDAGYEPESAGTIRVPAPPGLAEAAGPLLDHLGLNPARVLPQLDAYQYIVCARPFPPVSACDSGDSIPDSGCRAEPAGLTRGLDGGSPLDDPGRPGTGGLDVVAGIEQAEPPGLRGREPARTEPRPPGVTGGRLGGTPAGRSASDGRDPEPDPLEVVPLSFAVCVSDEAVLRANLLASPCLGPGSPHEVILIRNIPDAASGLNEAIERARHERVVCVHQDVYLPRGWDRRIERQYRHGRGAVRADRRRGGVWRRRGRSSRRAVRRPRGGSAGSTTGTEYSATGPSCRHRVGDAR